MKVKDLQINNKLIYDSVYFIFHGRPYQIGTPSYFYVPIVLTLIIKLIVTRLL